MRSNPLSVLVASVLVFSFSGCAGGDSCSVVDNGDGTATISCDDGTTVTVNDGMDGIDGTNGTNGTDGAAGLPGMAGTSCTVMDNGDGTRTISCEDGTTATVADGADAIPPTPTLVGHNGDHGSILPYDVQAAYNDDTFFWRLTYRGNEGVRHQYLRYTGGAWQKEGGDRRDAQATIDGDADQGDTNILSTIYEQRTSIMVNDPNAAVNVEDFDRFGCFLTCHNDSRHMPEWTSANGHDGKWVDPSHMTGGASSGDVALDLWHWRGARSNPIARADDQNVRTLDWASVTRTDGDDGGRRGDSGQSVFFNQGITDGNPDYLMDPATTWGQYTFAWSDFWLTPFYYMTMPNAAVLGPTAPNPGALPWARVTGYTAMEGDTVPRRILRAGEGSRADITAFGTTFTPDAIGSLGVWKVQMQRALDTGNGDDVAFVRGQTYEVGFEVHLWEYTTRDHYVSFPVTMSLATGTGADIEAVYTPGSGPYDLPNWDDVSTYPSTRLYLFQPGINTWEFLAGENETAGVVYTDPVTGTAVDQSHGGAGAVAAGTTGCTGCHTVRAADGPNSMEVRGRQRGGVWAPTPHM